MYLYSSRDVYLEEARLPGPAGGVKRLVTDGEGRRRLMFTLTNPDQVRRLIPVFLSWEENGLFTDFIEGFSCPEGYCAVFAHPPEGDLPLMDALFDAPPPVRAQAVRTLISKLMTQNMPPAVQWEVLRPENLWYAPDGQVRFAYDLSHFSYETAGSEASDHKTAILLAEIIRGLFRPSIALARFLHALESGYYETLWEIYAAFAAESEGMAAVLPVYQAPPLKERLAAAQEKLAAWVLPYVAAGALAAAYVAAGWLLYHTVITPAPVDHGITQIGTVVLTPAENHDGTP